MEEPALYDDDEILTEPPDDFADGLIERHVEVVEIRTPLAPTRSYGTIQPAPTPKPPPAVYRPIDRILSSSNRQPR